MLFFKAIQNANRGKEEEISIYTTSLLTLSAAIPILLFALYWANKILNENGDIEVFRYRVISRRHTV